MENYKLYKSSLKVKSFEKATPTIAVLADYMQI